MKVQVFINSDRGAGRRAVDAELVLANERTCWVTLPSGKTIKRDLRRDFTADERARIEAWRRAKADEAADPADNLARVAGD